MSKVYILFPKVLKGEEADEWYNAHIGEVLELTEEDIQSLKGEVLKNNNWALFDKI